MARYALIKDGVVAQVIVADPKFFDKAPLEWKRLWDEVQEVGDDPAAEPGSTWTPEERKFARGVKAPEPLQAASDELKQQVLAILAEHEASVR